MTAICTQLSYTAIENGWIELLSCQKRTDKSELLVGFFLLFFINFRGNFLRNHILFNCSSFCMIYMLHLLVMLCHHFCCAEDLRIIHFIIHSVFHPPSLLIWKQIDKFWFCVTYAFLNVSRDSPSIHTLSPHNQNKLWPCQATVSDIIPAIYRYGSAPSALLFMSNGHSKRILLLP